MEEIKFPIYKFSLELVYSDGTKGSFVYKDMFDENTTKEDLMNEIKTAGEYLAGNNEEIIETGGWYEFIEYETWFCSGIGFNTLNEFNSKEEALQSFKRYADRKNLDYEHLIYMMGEGIIGKTN